MGHPKVILALVQAVLFETALATGNNSAAMASNSVDRPMRGARLTDWREIRVLILPGATLVLEGVTHETSRDLRHGA